jgi:recombination protein RecA
VKVEKNKLGAPFQECEFNIIYGEGIDKIQDIIDVASEDGIIKKYGKSITFEEVKYDADEFKKLLIDNVEFQERLRNIILNPQIETNEPTSEIQETV